MSHKSPITPQLSLFKNPPDPLSTNQKNSSPKRHQPTTREAQSLFTRNSMAELEVMMPLPELISFLSSLLQRVAISNDLNPKLHTQKISAFHGLTRPSISIQSYLERIFKYANCSPSCFIVAFIYLDRFSQSQPSLPISSFNAHRLLITSVLVAAKFMDDMYYNNAYYAKVGGISRAEMNLLEVDFLFGLKFQLNVTPNAFHSYCSFLHKEMSFQSSPLERPLNLHCSFHEDESTNCLSIFGV